MARLFTVTSSLEFTCAHVGASVAVNIIKDM
jgi:hypothetical protein